MTQSYSAAAVPTADVEPSFVRTAAGLCIGGGVIAAVGATISAVYSSSVPDTALSSPFSPTVFTWTEVLWTLTHVLLFIGTLAYARTGLAGKSRMARVGLGMSLVGMALAAPSELGFAFFSHELEDATGPTIFDTAIGISVTVAAVGFILAGIATLRIGSWTGWGRYTPLLCGGFVVLVMLPVMGVAPDAFLWPIAGRALCFVLFGVALFGESRKLQQ